MPSMKNPPAARHLPRSPGGRRPSLAVCYVTCRDRAQARLLARTLLAERLVACVNLVTGMESLYWWQGAVCEAREVVLIAKTRRSLVVALTRRVLALHSYEVPCVVALDVLGGNPRYLAWVAEETRRRPA